MKTVSVLLSTYNGEKYILEQLESLRIQSRHIDEVLIIDDCSTDSTVQVCRDYISYHQLNQEWRVFINETNKGWIINFHEGQKMILGDIVFFCDQDDIWKNDKVQQALDILDQHEFVDVIATREDLLYNDGNVVNAKDSEGFELINISKRPEDFYIRCSGCTMAFRRKFSESIYDEFTGCWAHDDMMWKIAGANGRMLLCHKSSILHRIHGNNVSRQKRRDKCRRISDIQEYIVNLERYRDYLFRHIECEGYQEVLSVTEKHLNGNYLRLKFLQSRNILFYFRLATQYRFTYRTTHQLLGDLVVAYGKK